MQKEKAASFIKGFVCVFLVMVLALVYVGVRRGTGTKDNEKQPSVSSVNTDAFGSLLPSETAAELVGRCDILFGCAEGDRVDFLLRAVFDLDNKQVTVSAIPGDLTVSYGGAAVPVGTVYARGGAAAVAAAVGGYYSDSFDRYYICTPDSFASATKLLGSAEISVEQDISFVQENVAVNLKKGKHSLYGRELYQYLVYGARGEELLDLQAKTGAAMLRSYITYKNTEKGEALFSSVINCASSNITAYDYAACRGILSAMASSSELEYRSAGAAVMQAGDAS